MTNLVLVALAITLWSDALWRPSNPVRQGKHVPALVVQNPARQPFQRIAVTLVRDYGYAVYRECRTFVGIADEGGRGWTELSCEYNRTPPAPLRARLDLSAAEVNRIKSLFPKARLYDRDHIGCDNTASDGIFEMLKADSSRGTVVLVTSCNRSFIDDPARRELLALLKQFEERLRAAALSALRPARRY